MLDWLKEQPSLIKISLAIGGAILISVIIAQLLFMIINRLNIYQHLERRLVKKMRTPVFLILINFILHPVFNYLGISYDWLDHLMYIILIISCAWLLIKVVAVGRSALLKQYDIKTEDNLRARKVFTQVRVFERIAVVVIVVVGFGLALMTFENIRKVGISLLTSAGIAGIIVGLAAQKLIGNILAGLQIAITQPIRIDDVVIVENEWGRIEEITLTFVVINIWDKRRLVVPSTYFIEKPFQNWTRTTSELLGTVFIHTDFSMDVDVLRNELTRILENTELWDKQVNVLQVTDAKERTLELRALMSASDSPTAWDLRVHVREELVKFMQKNYPEMLPLTRIELGNQVKSDHSEKN